HSASIAADGLPLFANRTHLADTLVYPDYVSVCGSHLAVAQGGDRYAMHGKRIVFDGRDVSRDRSRSWVSPSCSADGTTLVAAASVNPAPPAGRATTTATTTGRTWSPSRRDGAGAPLRRAAGARGLVGAGARRSDARRRRLAGARARRRAARPRLCRQPRVRGAGARARG